MNYRNELKKLKQAVTKSIVGKLNKYNRPLYVPHTGYVIECAMDTDDTPAMFEAIHIDSDGVSGISTKDKDQCQYYLEFMELRVEMLLVIDELLDIL